MRRLATLMLAVPAGCATLAPNDVATSPGTPTRSEAARALVAAMSCLDLDGYTDCFPEQPSRIRFDRFRCVAEPPRGRELARADCRVSGTLTWSNGRTERLPGRWADFYQVEDFGRRWRSSGLRDGPPGPAA